MRYIFGLYESWVFGLFLSEIPGWGWFVVETWLFGVNGSRSNAKESYSY